jgi:hypothetical protein
MRKQAKMTGFLIDSFDSDVGTKQHWDETVVLQAVKARGRFSTFEMTSTLMLTLNHLVSTGKIEELPSAYPFHCYRAKSTNTHIEPDSPTPKPTGGEA